MPSAGTSARVAAELALSRARRRLRRARARWLELELRGCEDLAATAAAQVLRAERAVGVAEAALADAERRERSGAT